MAYLFIFITSSCPLSRLAFYCSLWEHAGVAHRWRPAPTRLQHSVTSYLNFGGWSFNSAVVRGDWNTNVSLLVHLEGTPRDWRFQSVEEVLAAGVVVVTRDGWAWVGKHCGTFFWICVQVSHSVCVCVWERERDLMWMCIWVCWEQFLWCINVRVV